MAHCMIKVYIVDEIKKKSPLRAERGALLAAAIIIYEFMASLSGYLRGIPAGISRRCAGRICRL